MSVEIGPQNDELEMTEMVASDQPVTANRQDGEDAHQLAQPTAPPRSPPQPRFRLAELQPTVDHHQASAVTPGQSCTRSPPDQQTAQNQDNNTLQYQQPYGYTPTLTEYPSESAHDIHLENESLQRHPPYNLPYSPEFSNLPAHHIPPFPPFPPPIPPNGYPWWTPYSPHLPPIPPPVLPPNGNIYWTQPAPGFPSYPSYPFYPNYYYGGFNNSSPLPPWFNSPPPFPDPARAGYPPVDWMMRSPASVPHHPEIPGEDLQRPPPPPPAAAAAASSSSSPASAAAAYPRGDQPHGASVFTPSSSPQGQQLRDPGERFWESLPPPPQELLTDDAGQADAVVGPRGEPARKVNGTGHPKEGEGDDKIVVVSPRKVRGVVVNQPAATAKNQYRCHLAVAVVALLFPLFGVPALMLAVKARRDALSTSSSKRLSSSHLARSSIGYSLGSFTILACVAVGLAVGYGVFSVPDRSSRSSSSDSASSSPCPASSTSYYLNSYCYLYRLSAASRKQCVFGFYSDYFCYYDSYYYGSDRDTCNGVGADRGADGNCYYTSQGACYYASNYIGGVCYKYALPVTSAMSCRYGVYQQVTGQCYYTTKSSTATCSYGDKAPSGLCYYTV